MSVFIIHGKVFVVNRIFCVVYYKKIKREESLCNS